MCRYIRWKAASKNITSRKEFSGLALPDGRAAFHVKCKNYLINGCLRDSINFS
jgi:hypothetical protein